MSLGSNVLDSADKISGRVTQTTGITTATMGGLNLSDFGISFSDLTLAVGVVTTIISFVITIWIKLESRKRRNRLFDLIEYEFKTTGKVPTELLNGEDKD